MITWLTDHPQAVERLLPGVGEWQTGKVSEAPEPWPSCWPLFHEGKEPAWTVTASPNSEPADAHYLVIEFASASQFKAVLQGWKSGVALPDRLVALALGGQGFQGQRQRPWTACPGNLHLTAHYDLGCDAAAAQAALTMLPAVVAAESIASISGGRLHPRIKWVNDVLLGDGKVAGVLTATSVRGATVDRVVFGIGLNIAVAPQVPPTPFVPRAICLGDADSSLRDALPRIFQEITTRLHAGVEELKAGRWAGIFDRYRSCAGFIGREVTIWPEGVEDWQSVAPSVVGRVVDLLPDLSLMIAGQSAPVRAGRMAWVTDTGPSG
ncbi:MAG TPA: hypothetical protein PKE26_04945 [Kiritimatiellia bacterium]|nr:hypothetical protein [Kiritimatiellia bacterium]HMO98438.1 hypothetical protein [Kiritimatiellia bacterium]HMP95856.1 hypothetical protein [Kiritimatiellia bacterium]